MTIETPSQTTANYRPDIDGLRALAIVSVVAFHVGIGALHGGFVGVDIFFVVSGYLIGGIVYREATSKTFTFAKFYQRRAKRILPAFFAVLLFCCFVAVTILSPAELRAFSATALAAIFSASNVQLWLTTGYFTNGSQFNPLLMTWSLAVEEQFYALFPIALLAVLGLRRRLVPHVVASCSIISFALGLWAVAHHPTAAFFLLPTRAWEIGAGVLLAIYSADRPSSRRPRSNLATQVLAGCGAALLVYSIIISRSTQFPGVAALAPVLGTLLLIETPGSFVNEALSTRPIVFIGRLSYSWYLWHWPMLSFARIATDQPLTLRSSIAIAAASFLMALGSFYFVEEPFRHSRTAAGRMLLRYGILLIGISSIPLFLIATKGLLQKRVPLARMEAQAEMLSRDKCVAAYGKTDPRLAPDCVASPNEQHVVALIGDSHASALAGTLRSVAVQRGYALDEIEKASCPPLQDATIYMPNHPGHDHECAAFNLKTLEYLRGSPQVEIVMLAGFWSAPFSQPDEGFSYVPAIATGSTVSDRLSRNNLEHGLETEVEQLLASHKKVVLIKDAPVLTFDPVRYENAMSIPIRRDLENLLAPGALSPTLSSGRAVAYDDSQESAIIDAIAARNSSVRVYDLKNKLCERGDCVFVNHGLLLYVDSNHLSPLGAETALTSLNLNGVW
jgi:peptidoglycan/LPS O-acetylase OafA/YrhL